MNKNWVNWWIGVWRESVWRENVGCVGKVGNGGKCEIDSVRVREQVIEQLPEVLVVRVNRFLVLPPDFEVRKNGVSVVPEEELLVGGARYRLRSACLHRGKRADFGHYVAVYKAEGVKGWVLCNDEEVVAAEEAPVGECYLVFYERCEWGVCWREIDVTYVVYE
jgi:singapore isolate B (sub-type 7) whole genome shotgun sequence assembly, scaffold_4